MSICSPSYGG